MPRHRRIQILLEESQHRRLLERTGRDGLSMGGLVRAAVRRYLAAGPVKKDPVLGLIGIGSSGDPDTAAKHDRYLYARKKERPAPRVKRDFRRAGFRTLP
jgi:hypothetical protein